jgi:hypothetical protein
VEKSEVKEDRTGVGGETDHSRSELMFQNLKVRKCGVATKRNRMSSEGHKGTWIRHLEVLESEVGVPKDQSWILRVETGQSRPELMFQSS